MIQMCFFVCVFNDNKNFPCFTHFNYFYLFIETGSRWQLAAKCSRMESMETMDRQAQCGMSTNKIERGASQGPRSANTIRYKHH